MQTVKELDDNKYIFIPRLLNKVAGQLAFFLERVLPSLSDDWWQQAVVNKLSYQQIRRLEQQKINSLASLDLAALLRVLDQNWYEISTKLDLTPEIRHFVKEMPMVRNRWAHATPEGVSVDDCYRDLDTLQRFASAIDAKEALLQEIGTAKSSLLARERPIPTLAEHGQHDKAKGQTAEFEPGQMVSLKANPNIPGVILAVLPGKPENRFEVFVAGKKQTCYTSQLLANVDQHEDKPLFSCEQFHAYLTALQIQYPGLSTLYSLNAARVDFIPYQFRPVLRFIRSDRPRLLIADGVGVGKTIEAGLILRELQARRDMRSILIICPRPLVTESKWKNEMKRFEERFEHLDGGTLRYCINEMDKEGVWPEQYQKVIMPYSLFDEVLLYGLKTKRKMGLLDLDPPPRFDLVIVDEAHHIHNQDTFKHKAVKFFCDHAEAVVFLTATPIQLDNNDLFVLLHTLRPDLIIDQESYRNMAGPNPFINQAIALVRSQEPDWQSQTIEVLEQAANTSWGQSILRQNPDFIRIRARLAEGHVTVEERVQLITDLEAQHTFAGIINRTRRRDIGQFTIRKPETVHVEFTPAQQRLHDELLRVQAEIFSRIHGDTSVKFMMTTIRRQAASCLYGLVPFLQEILSRHVDELSLSESDSEALSLDNAAVGSIESQIKVILEQARTLDPHDPKLEALRNIIRDKQSLQNNKIMLFSSFRHTLHYIHEHLKANHYRVGMIHGGTPDEERLDFRARFKKPRDDHESLDILLFSEIGCEGLDYQFCDCMVNYDLPWNPMKIEQRIGRIDRNGQQSESVVIVNMITPGTVDADIYERCLMRIGIFNSAMGGGEEILGEITKEIRNIAENYSLTTEEKKGQLQQLSDNKIRLIQEQELLEERKLELFGIRLPDNHLKKEIEGAASFWLSPMSIHRLVTLYLQQICGREQDFLLGDKPLKTLRLGHEARSGLLQEFKQLPIKKTTVYREWENWLKGGDPHLSVTFESECAMQQPKAVFLMPLHPLVKQAAMSFKDKQRVITGLKVKSTEVPAGRHPFAMYQWQFHGIREDVILRPIAASDSVTAHLSRLLEKAETFQTNDHGVGDSTAWDDLDAQHYPLWSAAREQHQRRNQEMAEYRRESLTTSHRARIALLNEQFGQTNDEKIRKMRQSQIAAAEGDYARRIQELNIAMERADVTAEAVAYGVLIVEGVE